MTDRNLRRSTPAAFYTVTDPQQARLLSDPDSQRFFAPFLASEKSVTRAASEVGCELHAMLYRVRTFLRAGLLSVTREEKRAGRPIKHYRSSHDAYFIPFTATPYADLEERLRKQFGVLVEELIRGVAAVLRQVGHDGRWFYRDDDGLVGSKSGEEARLEFDFDDPRWPTAYDFYAQVHLSRDEAKALQRELRDLHARYRLRCQVGSGERYIMQGILLPQSGD